MLTDTIALSSRAAWKSSLQIAYIRYFTADFCSNMRVWIEDSWGNEGFRNLDARIYYLYDLNLACAYMCFRCWLSASPGQHPHSCIHFSVCIVSLQGPESNRFKGNGWKRVLALLGPWPGCSWAKGSKARQAKCYKTFSAKPPAAPKSFHVAFFCSLLDEVRGERHQSTETRHGTKRPFHMVHSRVHSNVLA